MSRTFSVISMAVFISAILCNTLILARNGRRTKAAGSTTTEGRSVVASTTRTTVRSADSSKTSDAAIVFTNATNNDTESAFETEINETELFFTTTMEPVSSWKQSWAKASSKRPAVANMDSDDEEKERQTQGFDYESRYAIRDLRNICIEPAIFVGWFFGMKLPLSNCMVINLEGKSVLKNASEKLCRSYSDRFMGSMYRLPEEEKAEATKCWLANNGTKLVCACKGRCRGGTTEISKDYSELFKPCEEKDDVYHMYDDLPLSQIGYEKEGSPILLMNITDEIFEAYWSAFDDVIEGLEKNISLSGRRAMITKVYSPQKQKEIYGKSEFTLSTISVLWSLFCGIMICKLLHVVCAVMLDMEVESERDD